MKILCYINHYFGKHKTFIGKSSLPSQISEKELEERKRKRKEIVEKVILQVKSLGEVDVKVCGIEGFSLVPLDIDFSKEILDPTFLIYASIEKMNGKLQEYDYFINIEDDIYLPKETFERVVEFDKTSFLNEILHPNRLEQDNAMNYCVDLLAVPGWSFNQKRIFGENFGIANNPHSGLMILSRDKFKYAAQNVDLHYREVFWAKAMESAFANIHRPFQLWRSFSNLEFHFVEHLDHWISPTSNWSSLIFKFSKISWREWIPPIVFRIVKYLRSI